MRLLDLFCGAGGAAMGYSRAGFTEIVGVDTRPQPHYPFTFVQADAMTYPLDGFDAIHASPPCQAFTALKSMWNSKVHADLLTPTRERLQASGIPYVIENVAGAPMQGPYVILCGTMFGLGTGTAELRRHRLFELGGFYALTPPCQHYSRDLVIGVYGGHGRDRRRMVGVYGDGNGRDYRKHPTVGVYGNAGGASVRDGTQQFSTDQRREAMGIDWMTGNELSQALPPAYTAYVGQHLLAECQRIAQSATGRVQEAQHDH